MIREIASVYTPEFDLFAEQHEDKVILHRHSIRSNIHNRVETYEWLDKDGKSTLLPLTEYKARCILKRISDGTPYAEAFIFNDSNYAPGAIDMRKTEMEHRFTSTGNKFWRHRPQMEAYRKGDGHTIISTHVSPEGSCNLSCPFCLSGETLIDTVDGKKRIDSISVGNKVTVGNLVMHVKGVMSRDVEEILEIKLEDGTTIRSTKEHPFFTQRGFAELNELRADDRLGAALPMRVWPTDHLKKTRKQMVSASLPSTSNSWSCRDTDLIFNERWVGHLAWRTIHSIRLIKGQCRVWNLSCEEGEAFLANGVLVHNCSVTHRDVHSRIDLGVIQKYVMDLKERGLKAVILTGGGEPTAYPQFNELVQWISVQGLSVALITNGTLSSRVKPDTWKAFSWVRVSLNVFDGWEERIQLPIKHLAPTCVVGCSMVYTGEHEATKEKVQSRQGLLKKAAKVADKIKASYVRLLPNCLLRQEALLLQHRALDHDIRELGDPRFFHQHKVHGAPQCGHCHQAHFRPYLSEEKFHENGQPGTVYPCDSVVLNEAYTRFATPYQICHASNILDFLDGKIKTKFDPRDKCKGCVFTDNVNMLDNWKERGAERFEAFPNPLTHEEFV